MVKKKSAKPKLKPSPPAPHVEVKDQLGNVLPLNEVVIQEDAEGIFSIKIQVQVPTLATFAPLS